MTNLNMMIDKRVQVLEDIYGLPLNQIDRELSDILSSSRGLTRQDQPSLEFVFDQLNLMIERKLAA